MNEQSFYALDVKVGFPSVWGSLLWEQVEWEKGEVVAANTGIRI